MYLNSYSIELILKLINHSACLQVWMQLLIPQFRTRTHNVHTIVLTYQSDAKETTIKIRQSIIPREADNTETVTINALCIYIKVMRYR